MDVCLWVLGFQIREVLGTLCALFFKTFFFSSQAPLCQPNQVNCVQELRPDTSSCKPPCNGITVTSYSKQKKKNNIGEILPRLLEDYDKFKGIIEVPPEIKGFILLDILSSDKKSILEYQWSNTLRYVRIYFDTPTFDKIIKDKKVKFVDILSAIGGTMGLLTGFSFISAVEMIFFCSKFIFEVIFEKFSNRIVNIKK